MCVLATQGTKKLPAEFAFRKKGVPWHAYVAQLLDKISLKSQNINFSF